MIESAEIARTLAQLNSEGPNNAPCPPNCQLHPRGCSPKWIPQNGVPFTGDELEWVATCRCESQHNPNQSIATQVEQFYHNMRTWQSHCEVIRQTLGDKLPTVQAGITSLYDDLQHVADKTVTLYGEIARANLDTRASGVPDNFIEPSKLVDKLRSYVTRWDVETQVWALLDKVGNVLDYGATTGEREHVIIPGLQIRDAARRLGKTVAPYAAMLHTHPDRDVTPSWDDVKASLGIGKALYLDSGVTMLEHFVLSEAGAYSRVMPQVEDWMDDGAPIIFGTALANHARWTR